MEVYGHDVPLALTVSWAMKRSGEPDLYTTLTLFCAPFQSGCSAVPDVKHGRPTKRGFRAFL